MLGWGTKMHSDWSCLHQEVGISGGCASVHNAPNLWTLLFLCILRGCKLHCTYIYVLLFYSLQYIYEDFVFWLSIHLSSEEIRDNQKSYSLSYLIDLISQTSTLTDLISTVRHLHAQWTHPWMYPSYWHHAWSLYWLCRVIIPRCAQWLAEWLPDLDSIDNHDQMIWWLVMGTGNPGVISRWPIPLPTENPYSWWVRVNRRVGG